MPRTRIATFAACAAALLAGCGEDEDEGADRFREGYNAAIERLTSLSSEIQQAGGDAEEQSNRETAAEYERIATITERTRSDLAGLEPPEEATDEFEELLGALREGVRDLRAVAQAARDSDPEAAEEAAEELADSTEEISESEAALKRELGG